MHAVAEHHVADRARSRRARSAPPWCRWAGGPSGSGAAHVHRHGRVRQVIARGADDAVAEPASAAVASSTRSVSAMRSRATGTSVRFLNCARPRSPPGATSVPRPAAAPQLVESNRSGRRGSSRAASSRVRCLRPRAPPPSSSSISLAASMFWVGPGRARNATIAARIEKSSKSPTSSIRSSGSIRCVVGEIEHRLGAHVEVGVVAAAARPPPSRDCRRLTSSKREAARRTSGDGVFQRARARPGGRVAVRAIEQARARRAISRGSSPAAGREHVVAACVEHRARGPLGVEAIVVDALPEVLDVLPPRDRRRRQSSRRAAAGTPRRPASASSRSTAANSSTVIPPRPSPHR